METFGKAPVNNTIIVLNILAFFLVEVTGGSQDTMHMVRCGAMFLPAVVEHQEYYRIVTSMFLHFGMAHLVNNMLVLFVIGDHLERALGKLRYILLYMLGGIGGNLLSGYLEWKKQDIAVSAGASGAIFAVIGGLLCVVVKNRGQLEDLTTRKMLILAGFSLYFGLTSQGVDNAAHIGGFLCGIILAALLYRRRRNFQRKRCF